MQTTTKRSLLAILAVLLVAVCAIAFISVSTSSNAANATNDPTVHFTVSVGGDTTRHVDIVNNNVVVTDANGTTTVVVTYKIDQNDGFNSIVLIPEYDATIFAISSIVADNTTVLGTATITGEEDEDYDGATKIAWEYATNGGGKYEGTNGENEVFLTVTYTIIAVPQAETTYYFGLDVETEGDNNKSVAYYIEGDAQTGEQTEVLIGFNTPSITLIPVLDAEILFGHNTTTENIGDPRYVFSYNRSALEVIYVDDYSIPFDETRVEFKYVGDSSFDEKDDFDIYWFAAGDVVLSNNGITYDVEDAIDAPAAAGSYVLVVSADETAAYHAVEAFACVQINTRVITVTIEDQEDTYGSVTFDATAYSLSAEPYAGDTLNITLSTNMPENPSAGDYTISGSETHTGSYTIVFQRENDPTSETAVFTVNAISITVTVYDQEKQYTGGAIAIDTANDPENNILVYAVSGTLPQGYSVVLTVNDGNPVINPGQYVITASISPALGGNYSVNTTDTGTLRVTSAAKVAEYFESFFAGKTDAVYNGETQNLLTPVTEPEEWWEVISVTGNSQKDVNMIDNTVSDYTITITIKVKEGYTSYYSIEGGEAVITKYGKILPKAITITADDKDNVAYGTVAELTYTVDPANGICGNDNLNIALIIDGGEAADYQPNNTMDFGEYTIKISASNSNYAITPVNGTYTVVQAQNEVEITVPANAVDYKVTYNVSAVADFGTAVISYYSDALCEDLIGTEKPVNAGTYYAKAVVAETANYAGAEDTASFTIQAVQLALPTLTYSHGTVTLGNVTKDVNNNNLDDITLVYTVNNVVGQEYTAVATANSLTYSVAVDGVNSNYVSNSGTTVAVYSVAFSGGEHPLNVSEPEDMPATMFVFAGQSVTIPAAATLHGYTFVSWNGQAVGSSYTPAASVTLPAIWTRGTFTIQFKNLESDVEPIYSYVGQYHDPVTYPASQVHPTRERQGAISYVFNQKWLYNGMLYGVSGSNGTITVGTSIQGDMTFVAVFAEIENSSLVTYMFSDNESTTAYTQWGEQQVVVFGDVIEYQTHEEGIAWFKVDAWYSDAERTIPAPTTIGDEDITVYGTYKFDIGAGDVNANGQITTDDIALYRQWIVGGYLMNVVEVGDEWATVTAQNFNAEAIYFVKRVADINNDESRDIRDVSITRMAIVGNYAWDITVGEFVTGEAIARSTPSGTVAAIDAALEASGRAMLYTNVEGSTGIDVQVAGNLFLDLNGKTLKLESLVLRTSGTDATITIKNGTIIAQNGITVAAPNGNVVIENVEAYINTNEKINLQAASSSLHFLGAVEFYEVNFADQDKTVAAQIAEIAQVKAALAEVLADTNATTEEVNNAKAAFTAVKAPVQVAKDTHVVVEEEAVLVIKEVNVAVVDELVFTPAATEAISFENKSEETKSEEIVINGNLSNGISTFAELAAATGSVILNNNIVATSDIVYSADVTIDLNGKTITFSAWGFEMDNGTLTINGEGEVIADRACYYIDGGTLVINGGTHTSRTQTIQTYNSSSVIINNGAEITSTASMAIPVSEASSLTINNAVVNAKEGCVVGFGYATIVIEDGVFNCSDNFVVGTNGTKNATNDYGHNTITINGGTFNGGIQSAGYVACGIYVANDDTVVVNGGTFNVTNGVGILARSGNTTVGADVVFTVTGNGNLGKVGDSSVTVPAGAVLVLDLAAAYPGGQPTLTNNNEATVTTINGASTVAQLNAASGYVALTANITTTTLYEGKVAVGGQIYFANDVTLILNNKKITSTNDVALRVVNGATLTIEGPGTVEAKEAAVMAFDGSAIVINGGTFNAIDNFVIGTNGSTGRGNNTITINAGTFNGGIQSAGYVACGIYVANNDTVVVNGGTFSVTNGCGILARSGNTTVGEDVVFNVTGNGTLGKVGDSKVTVPAGEVLVWDFAANYPGGEPELTNNTEYDVYALVDDEESLREVIANGIANTIVLYNDITVTGTTAADRLAITADTTLDLNGKTIKSADGLEPTSNWSTLWVNNGAVVTIKNGTIGSCYDTDGTTDAPYGITVGEKNGTAGTVNLTNVNVYGGTTAVYVILGEANIYSGNYAVSPWIHGGIDDYDYLLNCWDANYQAGTAMINVYGGSFEKFNPYNCHAEQPVPMNFVAAGYVVAVNGNVYTVDVK